MLIFLLPLFGAIKTESYPPKLTPEEEKEYLDLFINKHDENARAKLIEHNLRLVAHIAKSMKILLKIRMISYQLVLLD